MNNEFPHGPTALLNLFSSSSRFSYILQIFVDQGSLLGDLETPEPHVHIQSDE